MKKNNIYLFLSIGVIILFGILMLLFAKTEPREGWHQASELFIEEIWSHSAGITILVFGLVLLMWAFISLNKPVSPKPVNASTVFFKISFFILKITVLLYAIMLLQYALGSYKVIPIDYSFNDESMSDIHMICITFIVCFGIMALITGLVSRKARKHTIAG